MKIISKMMVQVLVIISMSLVLSLQSQAQTVVNLPGTSGYLHYKPFNVFRNIGNADMGFNERGILFDAYQDDEAKLRFRYQNYSPVAIQYHPWDNTLHFQIVDGSQDPAYGQEINTWRSAMRIHNITGKVAIGDVPVDGDYLLFVGEGIITEKVKVEQVENWPDYIFEQDINLLTLKKELEFAQSNNHLPNTPSAVEVEEAGGIELGEMTRLQQENIEKLYLYLGALQQEVESLKEANALLKSHLNID